MHKFTTPCILGDLILGGFQYMFLRNQGQGPF
jgi:hypothetical protein